MTSAQHAAWLRRGSPWRLARPLLALKSKLRAYGYVVYDLGNQEHLDHQPPEHHCPYSESNWPSYQGKAMPDVVTAIDIMPPGSGLPSLPQIGAQLYADKQAGYAPAAFVVDMNWGPTSNRTAVRDTWRPGHVRSSSSDTGHIHLSCRSDFIDWAGADDYDPVARLRGQTTSSEGDGTVAFYITPDGAVYNENGVHIMAVEFPDNVASRIPLLPVANVDRVMQLTRAQVDDVDEDALVEKLAAKLVSGITVAAGLTTDQVQTALITVLSSEAGQNALVRAANTAEDH